MKTAKESCLCACLFTQLCPTLYDLMDCILPSSLVHGILQARIQEWVAMPSSRGSSQPRDGTQVSCIAGRFFTVCTTREAQEYWSGQPIPSPGDLPDPGIKPGSPSLQVDSLPANLSGMSIKESQQRLNFTSDNTLLSSTGAKMRAQCQFMVTAGCLAKQNL